MNRTQFIFDEEYYKMLLRMRSKKAKAELFDAICRYSLYGEPPGDGVSKEALAGFWGLKALMDVEIRQSKEGRRSSEYKTWRKSVYERDGYTCQHCGEQGGRLNAHHIKPYAFFISERYVLDNGITLCEACHRAEHRRDRHGD